MAPTFLTLPLEVRCHIYTLSEGLEIRQHSEISIDVQETTDGHEISVKMPKCSDGCFARLKSDAIKSFSVWVNRNCEMGRKEAFSPNYPAKKHMRKMYPSCKKHNQLETSLRGWSDNDRAVHRVFRAGLHGLCHTDRVVQPAITKVNKQIRAETLQLFYGSSQSFLFTIFDRGADTASLFKWLKTIGKENAGLLRSIKIVYRKKKDGKFIKKTLLPAISKLGVRTEAKQEVVVATRLTYPFCYCEECIRKLLGEG